MSLKLLVAVPGIASIFAIVATGGASQWMHLVWSVIGSSAGAYATAAYEVFMMLTAKQLHPYWKVLAALRISICFLLGLFGSLGYVSKRMAEWHEWETGQLAFLIALCGLVLIPILKKIAKLRLNSQFGVDGE